MTRVTTSADSLRERLSRIPGVDTLLATPEGQQWVALYSRAVVVDVIRSVLDKVREDVRAGASPPEREELLGQVAARLSAVGRGRLRRVINATGVVLHTNLGRAPLSDAAVAAVVRVAAGYSNLEYDLEEGRRGSRHRHGEDLLRQLTGAQAAMVVNNNAAAVLLVLATHCRGREVIISRGELIEIGGAFRIPDVLEQSGCILREVGTTNRTHLYDYERAVGEATAAILKVHTSNYRIEGFTHSVPARELAALCRQRRILLIEDLGSGVLVDTNAYGLGYEPIVTEAVAAGCDLVTFSGDKLLGGPQAGIIVGRAEAVEACKRHPLARALRVDKMTLAALQATLEHYLRGEPEAIPIWRMIAQPVEVLEERARRLCRALQESGGAEAGCAGTASAVNIWVERVEATVGGGSLPGRTLPSAAVCIALGPRADVCAARLRYGNVPVIGRIEDGRLLLDLRTVAPEDDELLCRMVREALEGLAI